MTPAELDQLATSRAFDVAEWTSFEAVVAWLRERREWARLERGERMMLHLLDKSPLAGVAGRPKLERERDLWRRLVGIYRDGLSCSADALVVAQLVANVPGASAADHEALGGLCVGTGELSSNPTSIELGPGVLDLPELQRAVDAILAVEVGVGEERLERSEVVVELLEKAGDAAAHTGARAAHCGDEHRAAEQAPREERLGGDGSVLVSQWLEGGEAYVKELLP